jgi:hypothetical protein
MELPLLILQTFPMVPHLKGGEEVEGEGEVEAEEWLAGHMGRPIGPVITSWREAKDDAGADAKNK